MRLIRSRDLPPVNTRAHRTVDTIVTVIVFVIAVALLRGLFWLVVGI